MRHLSSALLIALAVLANVPAFAADTVEYYYNDAQGSPVEVTDATGNVVEQTEYTPYGQA